MQPVRCVGPRHAGGRSSVTCGARLPRGGIGSGRRDEVGAATTPRVPQPEGMVCRRGVVLPPGPLLGCPLVGRGRPGNVDSMVSRLLLCAGVDCVRGSLVEEGATARTDEKGRVRARTPGALLSLLLRRPTEAQTPQLAAGRIAGVQVREYGTTRARSSARRRTFRCRIEMVSRWRRCACV